MNVTNGVIRENLCRNSSCGIYLGAFVHNITVIGNTCTGNSQEGIFLSSSDNNTLCCDNCSENFIYDISLWTSSNNIINRNTCTGNTIDGIFISSESNNNTLSDNNCTGHAQYGIFISSVSDYNTLNGNNCTGNAQNGINLQSSSNNAISWNICSQNNGWGVQLDSASTSNNITNNFAKRNIVGSIQDNGTQNTIQSNYNSPIAATFTNTTPITMRKTVQFNDMSLGGSPFLTYQWNFGDNGSNSTLQNPTHKFTTVGTYLVTLTIIDLDNDAAMLQVREIVTYPSTNGVWQDIAVGSQVLYCASGFMEYAELNIEGTTTGARVKITAQASDPLATPLAGSICFCTIEIKSPEKVQFPVPAKFFYDPGLVPSGVDPARLGVYHFENGGWVLLGGVGNPEFNSITVNSQSFSSYAIAVKSLEQPSYLLYLLLWGCIVTIAIAMATFVILLKRRKNAKL